MSAKAVPQMADSGEVLARVGRRAEAQLEALVLNDAGVARGIAAGADALVTVVAASETFSRRNARMSRADAVAVAVRAHKRAAAAGVGCRADIATSFGCAYEGSVRTRDVVDVAEYLVDAGYREIVLADTTGSATPHAVVRLLAAVRAGVGPEVEIGLHFHNTRGLGLVNVVAALESGVRLFDASIGGIGGCPFSPGATGNVCTEDLVHLLHALGLSTGIDLDALVRTARTTEAVLGVTLPGQVMRAGPCLADVPR